MIIWIHGRAPKPARKELFELWVEAVRRGLQAHRPNCLAHFESCPKEMIYYGDLSNRFLKQECDDIEHRRALLDSLTGASYEDFPGETGYGLEQPPSDIEAYWDQGSAFSLELRQRVRSGLKRGLQQGPVLLLAHSLGAVLSYDALQTIGSEHPALTLLTLGSPLSLPDFWQRSSRASTRKPPRLGYWHNISARGDRVCGPALPSSCEAQEHSVINPMRKQREPDPHHALGYLSHPLVAKLVADWLDSIPTSNLFNCPPRPSSSEPTKSVP